LHALWRDDQTSQLTANFIEVMLQVAPRTGIAQANTAAQSSMVATLASHSVAGLTAAGEFRQPPEWIPPV
jgi:hypothetical protein